MSNGECVSDTRDTAGDLTYGVSRSGLFPCSADR